MRSVNSVSKVFVGLTVVKAGDVGLACLKAGEHLGKLAGRRREPETSETYGARSKIFFALLLGDAAQDAESACRLLCSFL